MPGRADYHVYARMRSPIANAPYYVKSQSFMPWGDCYRTGHSGRLGRKGSEYSCKVNGIPLVFDELAAVNFTYPWRDNFCEQRDFLVGQCPGGYGHQGEDIRPGSCTIFNEGGRPLPALPAHGRRRARRPDLAHARQPRRLYRDQHHEQLRALPLPAHESEIHGRGRSGERARSERRRDHRQGRHLGRSTRTAPPTTFISTSRFSPRSAGSGSIPI